MDIQLAKLIQARRKSISAVEAKVLHFESMAKTASPAAAVALQAVIGVNRQRLAKLREELAGLEQLAGVQLEVPGTSSKELGSRPEPGPVAGKAVQGPTRR